MTKGIQTVWNVIIIIVRFDSKMKTRTQQYTLTRASLLYTDGDTELGYAGVPMGWNSKPYAWMPGALSSHFIQKYLEYLEILAQKKLWVDHFKVIGPINYDDDAYNEPPDDWYTLDSAYQLAR